MNANLQVEIASNLYEAGRTEDGDPYVAEWFHIVAESESGRRWVHSFSLAGALATRCEETGEPHFIDIREEAKARLGRVVARINAHLAAGGRLSKEHWREIDPAYGSQSYQDQGVEERRWMEERTEALYA